MGKRKKLTRQDKADITKTSNKCWKCGADLIKQNGVISCSEGCFVKQ